MHETLTDNHAQVTCVTQTNSKIGSVTTKNGTAVT